jgi:hypothetical protein
MYPTEIEYWSKYCDIVANYLQDSFGSSLEMFNLPLFRNPGEILEADEKLHVAVMLNGTYGDPEVKTVRLSDNYGDITSSDIFIMPFDRIKDHVLSNEYFLI